MDLFELKAELSMKILELEKAIEAGMAYQDLKAINLKIKELHYQIATVYMQEAKQRKDTLLIE
jgi:hypothetical protein